MKIIPKFQTGGGFFPAQFAIYTPVMAQLPQALLALQSSTLSSSRSSSKDDYDDFSKLMFKLLEGADLLPNELETVTSQISQMMALREAGYDTQMLSTQYAGLIGRLKAALFNKKEYDKAYNMAVKSGGLNEVAIDNGTVYVYDKDRNLKALSINEYLKNQKNYSSPITNSNLMYLRAHDELFSNNNLIFTIIDNSIGMNLVVDLIHKCLGTLGSDSESISGYVNKGANKQVISGIESLQKLAELQGEAAVKGIYKVKTTSKDSNKQAQAAIQYIWNSLTPNAQDLLKLKAGDSKNPIKGAMNYLSMKVMAVMNNTVSYEEDYQDDFNSDGTVKEKSGKSEKGDKTLENDVDLNIASLFLAGYGQSENFLINPRTNVAYDVHSTSMPLVKKDGTPLGANCSLQEITEGQFGPILNLNKATMGGRSIDPLYYNQVLISDGNVYSIDFPTDENGNPDLSPTTLAKKKEADKKIKAAGINIDDAQSRAEHASEINAILKECGLRAAYNSQGELISGNWARFAVMNGTADNRALGINPTEGSSHLLSEITEDNRIDTLIDTIKTKNKLDKLTFDKNDFWFESDYDMFLEGTIWVPLNVNYFNAQAGSGEKITGNLGQQLQTQLMLNDRRNELLRLYNKPELPQ